MWIGGKRVWSSRHTRILLPGESCPMVLEAGELGVASAIDRDGEAVVYFPRLVMGGERLSFP